MYLTEIDEDIHKKIVNRNGKDLTNLTTFIRVFSGATNGLIVESNPDWDLFRAAGQSNPSVYGSHTNGSGTVGVTWGKENAIQADGAAAKPRPAITLLNVREGQDQISKEATLNITAFSLEQLELIQQYFMEPGYSLFIEWGWNTQEGVKGLIDKTNEGSIIKAVGERALKDEDLHKARKNSVGDYDCFFGFITGGTTTSEGNVFNINVEMRGVPSLPAFLQSHHSVYEYSKETSPLEASSYPLYGESELRNTAAGSDNKSTAETNWQSVKEKRFKAMFNALPPIKQTKEVADLMQYTAEWYDFIGFDMDVLTKLNTGFHVGFWAKAAAVIGFIEDPSKVASGEFGVPVERFISSQRYIRFGFAMDILNANVQQVKYNVSGKELKSYIDVKGTKIGAFPYIFSLKKENLLIPGNLPDFSKFVGQSTAIAYKELLSGDGVDLRIKKEIQVNGTEKVEEYISFVQKDGLSGEDTNSFKEIGEYYGSLENLYINFDFFAKTITSPNKNLREILTDLLNGMSSAVNSFWNLQIIEKPGDDGILTIKVFDENWVGQLKKGPKSFYHQGINSVFLDATLTMKIPAEMMSQIINRRFDIVSQPEQTIVNVDDGTKNNKKSNETFFAKGRDKFLDVRFGNKPFTPPPVELTNAGAATATTNTQSGTTDNTNKWNKPDGLTKEQKEANKKVEQDATNKKVLEVESLKISKTKNVQLGDNFQTEYYDTNGKLIAIFKSSNNQYSGVGAERAKQYDKLLAGDRAVNEKVEQRKESRQATFNQNLNKIDIVVNPQKSSDFNVTPAKAIKENGTLDNSFGIYCLNDPIYFDILKNTKFQNYFEVEGGTNLLSPLLPITYKFKILGCSGIRRWDSFRIKGIPERYAEKGIWQITEVEHGLSGMQWVTEVTGTYRQLQ
jgi:hypothetical protein